MQEIIDVIQTNLLQILSVLFTTFASYIGFKVKSIYEKYVNDKTKKEVVDIVVRSIEQICIKLNCKKTGLEKFEEAKNKSISWLNEKGIKINELELELLIESSVNAFNQELRKNPTVLNDVTEKDI